MLLVLDTNQYLFAFGLLKKPSCESLIDILKDKGCGHTIRIPRLIVNEVGKHLGHEAFREFISFIHSLTTPDEDFFVPFELGAKYESLNRHFLSRSSDLRFKVINAEACLKILAK